MSRIKVIFPEFKAKHDSMLHLGKTGDMTGLDRSTGQAQVTFDDGQVVTIEACCLHDQNDKES